MEIIKLTLIISVILYLKVDIVNIFKNLCNVFIITHFARGKVYKLLIKVVVSPKGKDCFDLSVRSRINK